MTFLQLKQDCYRRLSLPSAPVADTVTRIGQYLNEVHEALLSTPGLGSLLYGTLPFSTAVSRARYGLSNVAQIRALTDAVSQTTPQVRSLAWYRATFPDPTRAEGVPRFLILLGPVAVAQVPASTGTGLWAVSSSAADVVPTVTIDATRLDGYPSSPAAVTLTGATRVAIGALTDYVDVSQLQLSAACAGEVSLYDAAVDGNRLAVIPRGQTSSRYYGFILAPTPSAVITYTVDVEHDLLPLSADTDEPLLPVRFHRLLAIGARVKEYEKTQDERYGVAAKEYQQGVDQLVYAVTCPPDFVGIPGRGQEARLILPTGLVFNSEVFG